MKKNFGKKLITFAMVCALGVAGTTGAAWMNNRVSASAEGSAPALVEPLEDTSPALYVAAKNENSVVGIITNTQTWSQQRGVVNQQVAQGSGVVIAEGGYVLTNNHVIEDGQAFQVLMPSGDKIDATLIGADSATDLAVLQVNERADELVPVTMGSIEDLKVGSTAIAIGNPGGEVLAHTVTKGIVSALERTSVNTTNTTRRISYIQHDAAISSGNSGGGLFNYKGELIGINTLKYSGSAYSSSSFEGLGFAIPVDTAVKIAGQLMENGRVIRPGLGITCSAYEGPEEPLQNNAPASVCIRSINAGGAAEKAGLQQYDFIVDVDGQRISSMLDLTGVIDEHEAGDTVSVTVVRYREVGIVQQNNNYYNSPFGFGFGYGYGYGYGNNDNSNANSSSGTLYTQGGFDTITVQVTLEVLDN